MTNGNSERFFRLYVTWGMLAATGVFLIICGVFCFFLGFVEPQGRHGAGGLRAMATLGTLMLADGIGFLMPQLSAKLLSASLLVGAAVYIFFTDAFRWANCWIYCLLLLPLLLALSLRRKYSRLSIQELSNAN